MVQFLLRLTNLMLNQSYCQGQGFKLVVDPVSTLRLILTDRSSHS